MPRLRIEGPSDDRFVRTLELDETRFRDRHTPLGLLLAHANASHFPEDDGLSIGAWWATWDRPQELIRVLGMTQAPNDWLVLPMLRCGSLLASAVPPMEVPGFDYLSDVRNIWEWLLELRDAGGAPGDPDDAHSACVALRTAVYRTLPLVHQQADQVAAAVMTGIPVPPGSVHPWALLALVEAMLGTACLVRAVSFPYRRPAVLAESFEAVVGSVTAVLTIQAQLVQGQGDHAAMSVRAVMASVMPRELLLESLQIGIHGRRRVGSMCADTIRRELASFPVVEHLERWYPPPMLASPKPPPWHP